jgi:hypothetical protein
MKLQKLRSDGDYRIYGCGKGYIVHNKSLHFDQGHTHVSTLKQANDIILMCKLRKIPRHWDIRILKSLARVAEIDHANKIIDLIHEKQHKGKQHFNNYKRGVI